MIKMILLAPFLVAATGLTIALAIGIYKGIKENLKK